MAIAVFIGVSMSTTLVWPLCAIACSVLFFLIAILGIVTFSFDRPTWMFIALWDCFPLYRYYIDSIVSINNFFHRFRFVAERRTTNGVNTESQSLEGLDNDSIILVRIAFRVCPLSICSISSYICDIASAPHVHWSYWCYGPRLASTSLYTSALSIIHSSIGPIRAGLSSDSSYPIQWMNA